MEAKDINEVAICYLKKGAGGQVLIDYEMIDRPFDSLLLELNELCSTESDSITEIVSFIRERRELQILRGSYKYCEELEKAYQGFLADPEEFIGRIQAFEVEARKMLDEKQSSSDFGIDIKWIKELVLSRVRVWVKAYAIKLAYNACKANHGVLAFSHRECGWSNPLYQLTDDFSIEIKTNFGYGSATYFYTKLTFKGVEIVPFSDWVTYRFAKFYEVVRYSKRHEPKNEKWLEAMEYARDACNMTLLDEKQFVEVYIVQECERMVSRLEEFIEVDNIEVRSGWKSEAPMLDISGGLLVDFRGEKISGALDFVAKIREFENVIEIQDFITRIEDCNKRLYPVLVVEEGVLRDRVRGLKAEELRQRPGFYVMKAENEAYNEKRTVLRMEMPVSDVDDFAAIEKKVSEAFALKHPEYEEFMREWKVVRDNYIFVGQDLRNQSVLLEKVVSYLLKMGKYFAEAV